MWCGVRRLLNLLFCFCLPDLHGSEVVGGGGDGGKNDSYCWVCHEGGEVLCCDKCPRVFHFRCTKLDQEPEGEEWYCSVCTVGALCMYVGGVCVCTARTRVCACGV